MPPWPDGPRFPPAADLGAAGPYTATTIPGSGPGGGYTVFHPQQLAPDGLKHPIVTWGNGATTAPPLFPMLPHLASHGFVVIASDNAFVTSAELNAGIDWLIAENERTGSPLFQKLDPTKVASMGYSLGSLGTFEIAADPRLTTTVHISGGAMDKAVVPNLKKPPRSSAATPRTSPTTTARATSSWRRCRCSTASFPASTWAFWPRTRIRSPRW